MAYAQGSVVLAPATFKSGIRPYLVVSNAERPFFGTDTPSQSSRRRSARTRSR